MLPVNFNLVLIGENFPVQSISVAEFEFNHRKLRETVRFPMGINAETRGAQLQVLPDRIQVSVIEVRDIATDASNLTKMIEPVFDYIGPKSFNAVGHNAQFLLDSSIPKSAVTDAGLNIDTMTGIVGASPTAADISIYRETPSGAVLRTGFLTQTTVDQIVLDFNAHFDLSGASARSAIESLPDSLSIMVDIAERANKSLQQQRVGG